MTSTLLRTLTRSAPIARNFLRTSHATQVNKGFIGLSYAPLAFANMPNSLRHRSFASGKDGVASSANKGQAQPSSNASSSNPQHSESSSTGTGQAKKGSGPIAWLLANKARMTEMAKEYGYFVIATYLGIYVIVLGGIYVLVKTKLIAGPDAEGINAFINGWFIKKAILGDRVVNIPPGFADFATAWVLTKTTEPVRLVTTLAIVPSLARRLPPPVMALFGVKKAAQAAAAAGAAAKS